MNHAITVHDVLVALTIPAGFVVIIAFFVALVYIFNPFRSGH